jgi:hypothetical protein
MRSITSAWQRSMKLMIFICPPQHGHTSGSTSYTRLISIAQVEMALARGPRVADSEALSAERSMGTVSSLGSSALQRLARIPRCR